VYILGAGMAGCLAGVLNSDAILLEQAPSKGEIPTHKALLRFRSDKIGKICAINFDKVAVKKSIYYDGREYRTPDLRLVNLYSKKVAGGYYARSILDLSDVERYIAPEGFHEMLLKRCAGRIHYGCSVTALNREVIRLADTRDPVERVGEPVISTLPMPIMCKIVGRDHAVEFWQEYINVIRYRVKNCNIYQTMYYPDPSIAIYRASVLRDLLIIEAVKNAPNDEAADQLVFESLGIRKSDVELMDYSKQMGKIAPVPEDFRKDTILNLTIRFGVYSLGRFSCWRNVLLDDVYDDALKIRSFIDRPMYDVVLASHEGGVA